MPLKPIDIFDPDVAREADFHAVVSIQLCELAHDGWFNLADESWDFGPKYSAEQHAQLCDKITKHYWYREICVVPPGIWKTMFLEKMNEIMPKYMHLYAMLDKNNENYLPIGQEGEYYKSRNIFSDFPSTRLGGNEDYASNGNDTEYQRIKQMDLLEMYERVRSYKDVDALIIEDISPLFSTLHTVNVNYW